MNAMQLSIFAEICAVNARVQSMIAENQHRMITDNVIAYGEDAFRDEANILMQLSYAARNT